MAEEQQIVLMLGELRGAFGMVQDDMKELMVSQRKLTATVDGLPCRVHTTQLKAIEDWRVKCNGEKEINRVEKMKGNLSLRNGIIIGVLTFIFGVVTACLSSWVVAGVP